MTNLAAFMIYIPDENLGTLVLTRKGITPTASDANDVSGAWGMIEKAKQPDYSQGKTSEKLTGAARQLLLNDARVILTANGISFDAGGPKVSSYKW